MRLKKSQIILALGASLFCVFSSGIGQEAIGAISPACGQPKSEADVRALLLKWRDQVRPGLPAQEVKLVESEAAALPVDLPADQLGATFEDSETKIDIRVGIKAQRRDTAYALAGYGYTFLGGNFAGQDKMKDLGFWCFLEAALLKMTSDHLLNVGFHLNERGAFDDALIVLCYAAALSPAFPAVHNNLAYNLAARGNVKEAVDEAAQALNLAPQKDSYRRRLEHYGRMAGVKVDSLIAKAGAQPSRQMPYSPAFFDFFGLYIQAMSNFRQDYYVNQLMTLNFRYTSNQPGSARSALDNHQQTLVKQRESCEKAHHDPICQCELTYARQKYASTLEFYLTCYRVFQPWINAAQKAFYLIFEGLGQELEKRQKRLWRGEFEYLNSFLESQYFLEVGMIEATQWDLDQIYKGLVVFDWEELQRVILGCRAKPMADDPGRPEDFFGKRPPQLRRRIKDSDKPWVIWFYFGDLKLFPDDTAKLTVGISQLTSLKVRYNFRTKDFGAGVGLGLNVSKFLGPLSGEAVNRLLKFELFASVSTDKGFSYGLETGMKTKNLGPVSRFNPVVVLEN
jgi:hypothetical protein